MGPFKGLPGYRSSLREKLSSCNAIIIPLECLPLKITSFHTCITILYQVTNSLLCSLIPYCIHITKGAPEDFEELQAQVLADVKGLSDMEAIEQLQEELT